MTMAKKWKRQTRDQWDCGAVRLMLVSSMAGDREHPKEQNWISLLDEANHRIAALEKELLQITGGVLAVADSAKSIRKRFRLDRVGIGKE